jgi:hypothetical protein
MAQDFADSILACAPWYLRVPLKCRAEMERQVARWYRRVTPERLRRFGAVMGLALSRAKSAFEGPRAFEEPGRASTDEILVRELLAFFRSGGHSVSEERVRGAAARIVGAFEKVGPSNLTRMQWDEIAQAFWEKAPKGAAALTTGLSLLAALGVLIYTAFDPLGGTVLVHFMMGKAFLALTVKELLVAAGFGALVHGACATVLQARLEGALGPFQLSRFFALACDELGLPREHPPGSAHDPMLPGSTNAEGICLRDLSLCRQQIDLSAVRGLQQRLESLS